MLARPLFESDSGLGHDILALPYTCKGKVPEIDDYGMLEPDTNDIHLLGGLQITFQPGKSNISY
jgi:hypothetical protein